MYWDVQELYLRLVSVFAQWVVRGALRQEDLENELRSVYSGQMQTYRQNRKQCDLALKPRFTFCLRALACELRIMEA